MVQFLSIIFFSWISSIFVGFFKSPRFFCAILYMNLYPNLQTHNKTEVQTHSYSSDKVACKILQINRNTGDKMKHVGYTTTNSFYRYNQDATTNTDATSNAEEYYRPTQHSRAHDVSDLPALIGASVIVFVNVCKVQFSVQVSYLLICTVYES